LARLRSDEVKVVVTLTIPEKALNKIDSEKGKLSRGDYIAKVLKERDELLREVSILRERLKQLRAKVNGVAG